MPYDTSGILSAATRLPVTSPYGELASGIQTAMQTYGAMQQLAAEREKAQRLKEVMLMDRLDKVAEIRRTYGPGAAKEYARFMNVPMLYDVSMAPPGGAGGGAPSFNMPQIGLRLDNITRGEGLIDPYRRAVEPSRQPEYRREHERPQGAVPMAEAKGALELQELQRRTSPLTPEQEAGVRALGLDPSLIPIQAELPAALGRTITATGRYGGRGTPAGTFSNVANVLRTVDEVIEGRPDILRGRLMYDSMSVEEQSLFDDRVAELKNTMVQQRLQEIMVGLAAVQKGKIPTLKTRPTKPPSAGEIIPGITISE